MKTYYLSIRRRDFKLVIDTATHGKILYHVEADSFLDAKKKIEVEYLI